MSLAKHQQISKNIKIDYNNIRELFYEKVKDLTNKRNKLTEEIGKRENLLEVENEKIRIAKLEEVRRKEKATAE